MAKKMHSRFFALVVALSAAFPFAAQAQSRPVSGTPAPDAAKNADGTPHDPFWRLRRPRHTVVSAVNGQTAADIGPRAPVPVLGAEAGKVARPALARFQTLN